MTRKHIPVSEVAAGWFKDLDFVKEYDALEEEFALAAALIDSRSKANMTQTSDERPKRRVDHTARPR